MAQSRERANALANGVRRYQVRVLRYVQHLNGQVQGRVVGVRADLVKVLAAGDPTEPSRIGDQLNRVDRITVDARKLAAKEYRGIDAHTSEHILEAARHDQGVSAELIGQHSTLAEGVEALPRWQLRRILERALIEGAPSAAWWARQGADVAKRFHDTVRQGLQAGESIGQLIKRVRGTGPTYLDGIMGVSQRNAEALVRSSVLTALNDARAAQLAANDDVVRGRAICTTFDDRTCPICMALSGAAFDLNGDPLPGSKWPHRLPTDGLPLHWSCRCTWVPVLVGEPIPDDLSFETWLRGESATHQREILGDRWYTAWKSGALPTLRDRIDQRGRPITLDHLRYGGREAA